MAEESLPPSLKIQVIHLIIRTLGQGLLQEVQLLYRRVAILDEALLLQGFFSFFFLTLPLLFPQISLIQKANFLKKLMLAQQLASASSISYYIMC